MGAGFRVPAFLIKSAEICVICGSFAFSVTLRPRWSKTKAEKIVRILLEAGGANEIQARRYAALQEQNHATARLPLNSSNCFWRRGAGACSASRDWQFDGGKDQFSRSITTQGRDARHPDGASGGRANDHQG